MLRNFQITKSMPCKLMMGLVVFAACTNDKYDLSDIDSTVGVGGEITLPSSSIRQVQLDDLLDLSNTSSVTIRENGDYVFEHQGARIAAIHPMVEKVTVQQESVTELPLDLDMSGLPSNLDDFAVGQEIPNSRGSIGTATESTRSAQHFDYRGKIPASIQALTSANVTGTINLKFDFTEDLQTLIQQFNSLEVTLPPYMLVNIKNISNDGNGAFSYNFNEQTNVLSLRNVNTLNGISIEADVPKLDFTRFDEKNSLVINGDSIVMKGDIGLAGEYPNCVKRDNRPIDLSKFRINTQLAISDLTVNSAHGNFSPEIELNDLGEMELDDLPDFLTDDNVVADLYNPQVVINIRNDMDVAGTVDGALLAKRSDGTLMHRVPVNGMKINASSSNNGLSEILLCRTKDGINLDSFTDVLEVPELSNIIKDIPDNISFEVNARADASQECEFELGHQYTIDPSYRIEAPLSFARGARIVYNDTIKGWTSSLEDIEITDNTQIQISANVENCVPAYLVFNVYAIDKDGRELSDFDINVDKTIAASTDGVTRAVTPLNITIKQKAPNALKKLDGVKFNISAQASDDVSSFVEGITLNAYRHSLLVNDIKIKVVGQVIFPDKD